MYFYSKEDRDAEIRKSITEKRAAAAAFLHFRDVSRKFDGKMFNCRFEKALEESQDYYWYVKLRKGSKDSTIIEVEARRKVQGSDWKTVAFINTGEGWNKRIDAEKFIAIGREQREKNLRDAAELEEAMEKTEAWEKQLDYFSEKIKKIVDSIPYEIQSVYRLRYYVQK